MVQVLMGLRGSGKTKQMIDLINQAASCESGHVIAIERGVKLSGEIRARTARLLDTKEYDIRSYQVLRGFITGLYAGNYDISHVFIDSLFKIAECEDITEFERFIDWLFTFHKAHGVKFTITVSADQAVATEKIRQCFMV